MKQRPRIYYTRPPILTSISASIGDWAKTAIALLGRLRARQIQSQLFARDISIELPRRLKPHSSKRLGNSKPVPYLPTYG